MAVTTTRKLKMIFNTDTGDVQNVTLNYVKDGLKTGDGATLVHDAMLEFISQQPLEVTLEGIQGAQVIETETTDVVF